MKPSRRERLSSCERSQRNIARYSIHITYKLTEVVAICTHCELGSGLKAPYGVAVNYYPNTDRMKTTVQYPPQVALEGVASHPNLYL